MADQRENDRFGTLDEDDKKKLHELMQRYLLETEIKQSAMEVKELHKNNERK